jgi:outer membrane protein OmpA-like peptidoglycan-associated protein
MCLVANAATAQAPTLTPRKARTSDAVVAGDLALLSQWASRVQSARRTASSAPQYPFEKAQRWVALAREAYEGNAADPLPTDALQIGAELTQTLEAGRVPPLALGSSAPTYALRVREDLWRYADSVRALPSVERVAAELATLEINLIRAGLSVAGRMSCVREAPEAVAERAALAIAGILRATPAPAPVVVAAQPAPVVRVDTVYIERTVAAPVPVPVVTAARPLVLRGVPANVHFGLNQDTLAETSKAVLSAAADSLLKYAAVRITLYGNTDSRGSKAYNAALSQRRAARVQEFLVGRGVEASRIQLVAFGAARLKAKETNVVDLARNRRVDITYLAGEKVIETLEGLSDLQVEKPTTPRRGGRARP